MSATDFDPFTRPRVGHLQADLKAAGVQPRGGGGGAEGGAAAEAGFSFGDLLDVINPLQHLPVIGNVYRALTGDEIGGTARIVGGGLYGGPFGLVGAAFNQIFEDATGRDMAETALAAVTGEDLAPAQPPAMAASGAPDGASDVAQAPPRPATTAPPAPPASASPASTQSAAAQAGAQPAAGPADPRTAAPQTAAAATAAAATVAGLASPQAPSLQTPSAAVAAVPGKPLPGQALTGQAALAALAADLRAGGAASGPAVAAAGGAAEAQDPRPAAADTPTSQLAARPGVAPDSFMPVSPRDFAGPRPQTTPSSARPPAEPASAPPRAAADADGGRTSPVAPVPKTPPQAAPPAPSAAATGAGPLPATPPRSDADFAERMMQALMKYEALTKEQARAARGG